ncbi:hypothetical protein Zm00014a_005138 [Zea mays]|uniref:Uncharacterized protein n=1 Tax=Zea mays TaxID=4577 RepID=A0A3L6FSK1_MAIZE|nr:hypothetical protein Zm00014a_005138 [Zea mays]
MFDADAPVPVEAHLQKLKEMDDITAKTVLLVLRNLENNLSVPQFERVMELTRLSDTSKVCVWSSESVLATRIHV